MLCAAKKCVKRLRNAGRFCNRKDKKRKKEKRKQKVGVSTIETSLIEQLS